MMEHRVISASMLSREKMIAKLTELVNEAIREGWEPVGGVAYIGDAVGQAMVKRRS